MEFAKRAKRYAQRVVAGRIDAPVLVQLACLRFLNDLKEGEWRFDPAAVEHVCQFIELLPHVKGKWARKDRSGNVQLFVLQDWQIFILANLFGFLDKKTGLRRFRQALIMIPRKNGKSMLAAAIGLYMAFGDEEPGAEVYCGADTEAQAWEVFRPAKQMAERTPELIDEYDITVNAGSLFTLEGSRFIPVIGTPGDGASPHCSITDEYHEHKTSDQFDTFVTGMGAREQPLALVISTAGDNLAGPCYEFQKYAEGVLKGITKDPRLFFVAWAAQPDEKSGTDDPMDFKTWIRCNPNYGVSVFEDYLKAQYLAAKERPAKRNVLLTKHLNMWVSSRSPLFDQIKWISLGDDKLKLEQFVGRRAFMAADLATKLDIAALVILTFDEAGKPVYFAKFYLPDERIYDEENKNRESYAEWAAGGYLTLTPGNVIDFDYIMDDAREILGIVDVEAFGFDPWQARHFANKLLEDGAPMVEYSMTTKNLSEATKEFDADIREGKARHAGNPILDWMVGNVVGHRDKRDNVFPHKPDGQPHMKVDGAIAAIMCRGLSLTVEESGGLDDFLRSPVKA